MSVVHGAGSAELTVVVQRTLPLTASTTNVSTTAAVVVAAAAAALGGVQRSLRATEIAVLVALTASDSCSAAMERRSRQRGRREGVNHHTEAPAPRTRNPLAGWQ